MDDSTNTEISPVPSDGQSSEANRSAYWRANLKIMMGLLVIWFSVSFGCGILFVDALNEIQFFGWQLGFWFSQQGAIYVFVILNLRLRCAHESARSAVWTPKGG